MLYYPQIFEDSIKLNTVFTYARETLEKTGQLPPQQHEDVEGPDEDSTMTGTSSPVNGSRSEDEKDSDDERKQNIIINVVQICGDQLMRISLNFKWNFEHDDCND